jgi:NMD protein affecting ribosome stability and mRNA decay
MTDKFKCIECGENEVDDEAYICEDCWEAENEDSEEDEE